MAKHKKSIDKKSDEQNENGSETINVEKPATKSKKTRKQKLPVKESEIDNQISNGKDAVKEIEDNFHDKDDNRKRKSRFPIARIKRIMQSDEDIGKVSTTAPVVLSRGIELFIEDLVHKMIEVSACGGGRIDKGGFEKAITNDGKFDFLKVLLEKENDDEDDF